MDLSINIDFLNLYSNPRYPKIKRFFVFLNNRVRNSQKICETSKPKTKSLILKKFENPNPDLNLWVSLSADIYTW